MKSAVNPVFALTGVSNHTNDAMQNIISAILLMIFCFSVTFAQSAVTPDEYAVYNGVFEKRYEKSNIDKSVTRLAILESTIQPDYGVLVRYLADKRTDDYLYLTEPRIDSANWKESIKDLESVNKDTKKLEDQFSIEYNYNLVTKAEIDQLVEAGKKELAENCNCVYTGTGAAVWRPFFRKYQNSNGAYGFSRVGFSRDKKLTVVFVKNESGDHGDSIFYVLSKTGDKWTVIKYFGSSFIND